MAICPKTIKLCESNTLTEGTTEISCPDWECCLPFGAKLSMTDGCVQYTAGEPPADGVYGSITIADGCIVSAEPEEEAKYVGASCVNVPCPCSDDSGSGSSAVCDPSTTTGNLYSCDLLGKPLVKAYIEGGTDVSVTGNGTQSNPFVISIDNDAGVTAVNTETGSVISVTTSGGVATVNHVESIESQIINGMSFDSYGHLTGYTEQDAGAVNGIVGTNGVTANTDNSSGIVTVSLSAPAKSYAGSWLLGGYSVTLDTYNNITSVTEDIDIGSSTVYWGSQQVTYNSLGSITDVTQMNTTGNVIHGILPAPSSSVTSQTVSFTLLHSSPLVIDIYARTSSTSWGTNTKVTIDNTNIADTFAFTGSNFTHLRAAPTGVWSAGTHNVKLTNTTDGFSATYDISFQVTLTQNVTSISTS